MDFVWNETLGEQVRDRSQRALEGQVEETRRTADIFEQQANQHEARAAQLSASLPIMRSVTRSRTRTDSNGDDYTYFYTVQVVDESATAARRAEIQRMLTQAAEVRKAAEALRRAADELEAAMARVDQLFRELFEETRNIDAYSAARMLEIKEEIAAYINQMEAIRDSFGASSGADPWTASDVSALMGAAIGGMGITPGTFCPRVADIVAGIQSAAKDILDPINSTTGNFYYEKDDIVIPGRYPLVFKRFYNAMSSLDGVLGSNWTHNYNIRLYNNGEQVHIAFDDGHVETYTQLEEGFYAAPADKHNVLAINDNGEFCLHFPTMEQYCFNDSGALYCIVDANGHETTLEYEGKLLTSVYSACGKLSFSYNTDKHLSEVCDHTGRSASFEYNNGQLTKVTHPSGATFQYEYGDHGFINRIIDPLGVAAVDNEYDSEGRTVLQRLANGGVSYLKYDDANMKTTATEPNGNKVEYFRDSSYRTIKAKYADFEENYIYDTENNRTGHVDRNKNTWWYEFDIFGNLTKKTDPLGNAIIAEYNVFNKTTKLTLQNGGEMTFTYDEHGNQTSSVDPIGRVTQCKTDGQGRMYGLVLPDSSEYKLEFDERGNVIALIDSMGIKTLYEYNGLNQVIKATDGKGASKLFEYNANGNVSKATDAMGNSQTYEYNLAGRVTLATDVDGGVTAYEYDAIGNLVKITNPSGISTKATFDVMQNTASVTDHNGNTVYYEYDQYKRVVKTIDAEGNATHYEHDNNSNVTAIIDPLGARTEISYDQLNRQKSIIAPDGATITLSYDNGSNLTHTTDPLGNTTIREYDLVGQLIKLTDPMGNATQFTYTPLGQRESIINSKGESQLYSYYPGGRMKSITLSTGETETFEYDQNGNVSKITDTAGSVTTLEYDSLNRVIKSTDAIGNSKKFAYDAVGNITHIIDENDNTTQYKYSPIGDIIEIIDAAGYSTKYNYDNMSRLTKTEQSRLIKDPNTGLSHQEYQITTYERNKKGEVITTTSPMGDIVKHSYDKLGRMTSQVDEEGLETLYDYNLAGNLAKISYADGKTVEFSYDALRRLTEMQDWFGTTAIELDALGRTIQTIDQDGNKVGYTWNALDQKEKLTYPDGTEVSYEYDASGKLSKVLSGADVTSYIYDQAGRISERILPDGTKTFHEFNALGLITSLTHSKNGNILDQFKYAYDPVGNITQIQKQRDGVKSDTGTFNYTYDPLGRLTEAINGQDHKSYAYDTLGNRIASIQNGIETKYSYNARNQLIQSIENGVTNDYLYDKRGNLTQVMQDKQLTASYTFDATNMMVSAFSQGRGTAEYTYNGFSSRVRKLENLQAEAASQVADPCKDVRYVLDITRPYDNLLMTQGGQNQSYVWGNGVLSAGSSESTSFYYLQDHLGSPIRLLGKNNTSEALAYDEFGVPMIEAGQSAKSNVVEEFNNPFGFTRYQRDNISGLQYAQARYYNPNQGRFVAEDPIKDQLNWYGYCGANPVKFTDPLGLYRIRVTTRDLCRYCNSLESNGGSSWSSTPMLPQGCHRSVFQVTAPGALHVVIEDQTAMPRVIETTASIHFSNDAIDLASAALRGFGDFGTTIVGAVENLFGVVGGPSAVQSPLWDNLEKDLAKHAFTGQAAQTGMKFVKPLFIAYGVYQFASSPAYGHIDQVIRGFFERNSIPTSHTVVTHNGHQDFTAAVLLYAQMSAAHSFILEHSSYFFSNTWAGYTWYAMDRNLTSQLDGDWQGSIDRYVGIFRRDLNMAVLRNQVFLFNTDVQTVTGGFRQDLDDFHMRSNFINTLFVTTIAGATCAALTALSQITPVPSQLTQFSQQTSQQAATSETELLRQAHTNAQLERNQAWNEYQNSSSLFRDQARARFEAAEREYIDLSRERNVRPTNVSLTRQN